MIEDFEKARMVERPLRLSNKDHILLTKQFIQKSVTYLSRHDSIRGLPSAYINAVVSGVVIALSDLVSYTGDEELEKELLEIFTDDLGRIRSKLISGDKKLFEFIYKVFKTVNRRILYVEVETTI